MHGEFSVKSDVYSFGVLIMEIISGKKISSYYESDFAQDLLSYVSRANIVIFCSFIVIAPSQMLDENLT